MTNNQIPRNKHKKVSCQTKIAVFFGGKISQHLVMIRKAAKKLGVRLDLVSYNRVCFDSESQQVRLRKFQITNSKKQTNSKFEITNNKQGEWIELSDYDVLFFRTTGKHWEEVDLILRQVQKHQIIVDPLVLNGKPSMACKAYQMLALKKAGIEVPKTIYGSLWYLYETMKEFKNFHGQIFCSGESAEQAQFCKKLSTSNSFMSFPVIIKGSGGDRGTRVYKADSLEEMEKLVRKLRKPETEEGKRYMLQEFIENNGDYRVLVLGKKVLGVMKRSRQSAEEFRNNFSAGGKVEVADLPEEIKQMAVAAADACGLWVAGVDIMEKFKISNLKFKKLSNNPKDYVVLEVNKGPQFKGFMKATNIDVPKEIVKFLASLSQ